MNDRLQSWASIVLGAAVVVLVSWLTIDSMQRSHARAAKTADGGAMVEEGGARASASSIQDGGDDDGTRSGSTAAASNGALPSAWDAAIETPTMDAFDALGDGGLVGLGALGSDAGGMPSSAPRSVKLGVVLVHYAGAEGAPTNARSKAEAHKRALELLEQAKTDWKAAVRAGDSGSIEDMGRVPRGVLDRATEVPVFSLGAGEISEPLETPRGYWIVKRVE